MPKARTGYMFKRGNRFLLQISADGERTNVTLRNPDGKPCKTDREAGAARDILMQPLALADAGAGLSAVESMLRTNAATVAASDPTGEARGGVSIGDAFEAYRAAPNRPDSGAVTLRSYRNSLSVFAGWMKRKHPKVKTLAGVSDSMAADFIRWMQSEGKAAGSVVRYLNVLALIWRTLSPPGNPWTKDKIARPRLAKHGAGRRELSLDELRPLLESADGELRTLLCIGTFTGLRLGDAVRLSWDEVDLSRGMLAVVPRKTERTSGQLVAMPLAAPLRAVLDSMPHRSGPLCPELRAMYERDRAAVSKIVQRHFRKTGIQTRGEGPGGRSKTVTGYHSLRHSFASFAALAGWPEAIVREVLGHSSAAVTRKYLHLSNPAMARALPALPDPLASKSESVALPAREPVPAWIAEALHGMNGRTWRKVRDGILAQGDRA